MFKILGFFMNSQGKTKDFLEERMHIANKAWWRDVKIHRSKDVSWKVKCRRGGTRLLRYLLWK